MSKLSIEKQIYRHATDLSHACFRLLVIVMTYTDKNGANAHPSNARLAEESGMDVSNVRKNMKRLQELGYVVRTEDGGNQYGHGRANVYRVQVPPQVKAREASLTEQRARGDKSDIVSTKGGDDYPPREVSVPAKGGSHASPSEPVPDPPSDPSFTGKADALTLRERIGEDPWKIMLTTVQHAAEDQESADAFDRLEMAVRMFCGDEIADYHVCYHHTPPTKATERYAAGKWLTTMISTALSEGMELEVQNAYTTGAPLTA